MSETAASEQLLGQLRSAYLELLKKALTDTCHAWTTSIGADGPVITPLKPGHFRMTGEDWPAMADTMVGRKRLDSVHGCVEQVLSENIPGDLIETGVWRGGTTIFMRALLAAYGVTDRYVYVADSFAGLPPPDAEKYPQDAAMTLHQAPFLAVSMEQVIEGFKRYGLLDDHVIFAKGFFKDTLPQLHDRRWSVVRLDGDMYESTMDGLVNLYPNLSVGGYLLLDDYYHVPESAMATDDYRQKHGITEPIERVDNYSALWRKMR